MDFSASLGSGAIRVQSQLLYEVGEFKVENSRSKSGKHVMYSTVFVYKKEAGFIPYTKCLSSESRVKPTYLRGEAKLVKLKVTQGDFVVYSSLVKTFKKMVKGYISVYNYKGELIYRAKYLNGFVVKSKGNPIYAWLVRLFLDTVKIPVKGMRLGDEK